MDRAEEFGELKATVGALDRRMDDLREEVRAGFGRIETGLSKQLDDHWGRLNDHSRRLRVLERVAYVATGIGLTVAAIWGAVQVVLPYMVSRP